MVRTTKTFTKATSFIVPAGVKEVEVTAKLGVGLNVGTVAQDNSVMLIDDFGNLYGWGSNTQGQFGDGTTLGTKSVPYMWPAAKKFKEIFYDGNSSYALSDEGKLYVSGRNDSGKLGLGDLLPRSTPTLAAGGRTFIKLWGGNTALSGPFATDVNGDLWYIGGNNLFGAGGVGDVTARSTPTQVVGGYKFKKVLSIVALNSNSSWRTYGLTEEGDLYAWGLNSGLLGTGDTVMRSSPTLVVGGHKWKDFVVSAYQSYNLNGGGVIGLTEEGDLYSWGYNNSCILGQGIPSSPLVTLSSPTLIPGGRKWKAVSATVSTGTVFAIDEDDDCYAWGDNFSGQLGVGGVNIGGEVSSPTLVVGGHKWKQVVSPGEFAAMGIRDDGALFSWGTSMNYDLGDGTNVGKSSPVLISSARWAKIFTGLSTNQGTTFRLAARENGQLYSWGANIGGKLGLGDTVSRSTPTLIPSMNTFKRTPNYVTTRIPVNPGQTYPITLSGSPAMFGDTPIAIGAITEIKVSYEN